MHARKDIQAPTPNVQRNPKSQIPSSKKIPNRKSRISNGTRARLSCPTFRDWIADMHDARLMRNLWILCLLLSPGPILADGMVVPEVFYPKIEIPNQQAMIHFSDGLERLVIETSSLGEGTNFAWVVPLPLATLSRLL